MLQDIVGLNGRGDCLRLMDNEPAAFECYGAVINLDPENAHAWFWYAARPNTLNHNNNPAISAAASPPTTPHIMTQSERTSIHTAATFPSGVRVLPFRTTPFRWSARRQLATSLSPRLEFGFGYDDVCGIRVCHILYHPPSARAQNTQAAALPMKIKLNYLSGFLGSGPRAALTKLFFHDSEEQPKHTWARSHTQQIWGQSVMIVQPLRSFRNDRVDDHNQVAVIAQRR